MTLSDVARVLETSVAAVSMAYNAYIEDLETIEVGGAKNKKKWELQPVSRKKSIYKEF